RQRASDQANRQLTSLQILVDRLRLQLPDSELTVRAQRLGCEAARPGQGFARAGTRGKVVRVLVIEIGLKVIQREADRRERGRERLGPGAILEIDSSVVDREVADPNPRQWLVRLASSGGLGSVRGRRKLREIDRPVALYDEIHVRRIELYFLQYGSAPPDRGELRIDDQLLESRDGIAALLRQQCIADAEPERERIERHLAERKGAAELFCHILLCIGAQQVRHQEEPEQRVEDDQPCRDAERPAMQRQDREQCSKHRLWAARQFLFPG